ncbi:GNAT family N-acetyltransferase [soil metagenome]
MIETDRLILRRDTPADHAALQAMWADPRVMADLGPVKSAADSDAALAKHASYHPKGLGFWVVEHRADGAVMGFCGLKPGAPDTPIAGALEIGWMLAVPYWKQGFASEAAKASMAWAWQNRDDAAIVAITSRQNAKSRGLMLRLGMTHMPHLDFAHPLFAPGDPLRDTVTYRIARP